MQNSDTARRAYWTQQFEDAYRFMFEDILPYPVLDNGERLVSLRQVASAAGVEVHFSDALHVQQLERLFLLREGQIAGFIGAARDMNERGWSIRVEDGYRTRTIQKYLGRTPQVFDAVLRSVMWELGGQVPSAEFMFRRCSALVATVPKFGTHMSGSAIDISVVLRENPSLEVDRGAPYLEMSVLTPIASPFVSPAALQNRRAITQVMEHHGFVAYPWEFWHYSSGDAYDQFLRGTGVPAIYGAVDWDPVTGEVAPIANPTEPLNSEEEVRAEIDAALRRIDGSGVMTTHGVP
jgi:D-alanyl-D-alanine dipeptidase